MNIFHKTALKDLIKNRTRTMVTVAGVAMSAALITGVATFAVSLQNYMIHGARIKSGNWDAGFSDTDASFILEQKEDPRVLNTVFFENVGYGELEGGENPDKPYLFLAGFYKETFDLLPIDLISGRMPKTDTEVVVPSHVASNGGVRIAVGDTLTLSIGNRQSKNEILNQHDPFRTGEETLSFFMKKTYTVVGICQRPAFEEITAPGYTLITMASDSTGGNFSTFTALKNPWLIRSYANSAAGEDAYVLNDYVLRFYGISGDQTFCFLFFSACVILIFLVMLGSVFLIYNSFHISLNERIHQFGILMSIGATQKQLRSSVLFEGLCIGAAGIPLGMLIGIPSIDFVLSLVSKNFANVLYDNVDLTLKLSIPMLIAAVLISMVTILISAYLPARKAARIPIMECIRQTNEIKVEEAAVRTSGFTNRLYGFCGTLALKNFRRNRRRYRSIILSLMLSVVLFVSADAFRTDASRTAEQSAMEVDGDILFYDPAIEEKELFEIYDDMKNADGIYKSVYQAVCSYFCKAEKADLTSDFLEEYQRLNHLDQTEDTVELSMDIQFVADDFYQEYIEKLHLSQKEYGNENGKLLVIEKTGDNLDMFLKDSMEFQIGAEPEGETKTVQAVFTDEMAIDPVFVQSSEQKKYTFLAIAPYKMKGQFDFLCAPEALGITFWTENSGKAEENLQAILDAAGITSDNMLLNLKKALEDNRNLVFIIELFTSVFVVMISLIAIANVFNTISTNIRLRRRELAMLRSVGMSERDFNRMMCFECALYGGKTLLYGLPISGIFAWQIYRVMSEDTVFVFPWMSMGISILGVFFIIFLTMIYAVSKIKKENIIDALRDDMA